MKKTWLITGLLLLALLLGWCSEAQKNVSILDCVWSATPNECVIWWVEWIKDEFVRNCVTNNVLSKTGLNEKLATWTLQAIDIKDIDAVAKECVGYKASNPTASASTPPLFNTFLTTAAWSFAWAAIANAVFGWWRMNYNNMPISTSTYNLYREEEKRRWGWSYIRPWVFSSSTRSLSNTYRSATATSTKWTLWWSSRSWSSTSSSSSSLG